MDNNGWVNLGDVNPLEHGGIFIKLDEEIREFEMVTIQPSFSDEGGFLIGESTVGLSERWIEWDKVVPYADLKPTDSDYLRVYAVLGYYGHAEMGGNIEDNVSELEAIEFLESFEIYL